MEQPEVHCYWGYHFVVILNLRTILLLNFCVCNLFLFVVKVLCMCFGIN